MSTVDEIKIAIEHLSFEDKGRLMRWLHAWTDDEWDKQISKDAAEGRLDSLLSKAKADLKAGRVRDLP